MRAHKFRILPITAMVFIASWAGSAQTQAQGPNDPFAPLSAKMKIAAESI